MKTIAILAQKGGVGKTTLAVHLAVAAHGCGLRTEIVDIDPQATATNWGEARDDAELLVVSGVPRRLPRLIEEARGRRASLVWLDTPPNAGDAAHAAAVEADLILIPCRPAKFDLDAIQATLDTAARIRAKAFVVLNAVNPRGAFGDEAEAELKRVGAKIAPMRFGQRVAFSHGVIDGRSALEYEPGGKAAREVEALFGWVCGQVGLISKRRAI